MGKRRDKDKEQIFPEHYNFLLLYKKYLEDREKKGEITYMTRASTVSIVKRWLKRVKEAKIKDLFKAVEVVKPDVQPSKVKNFLDFVKNIDFSRDIQRLAKNIEEVKERVVQPSNPSADSVITDEKAEKQKDFYLEKKKEKADNKGDKEMLATAVYDKEKLEVFVNKPVELTLLDGKVIKGELVEFTNIYVRLKPFEEREEGKNAYLNVFNKHKKRNSQKDYVIPLNSILFFTIPEQLIK